MDATDRFRAAATALGLNPRISRFPEGTRTAADAAAAVGCGVGQIVKSLIFLADDRPVLVLTSGANRVDEDLVAPLFGAKALRQAPAQVVRTATGFAIGGTPPCGHPAPIPTVMDEDLQRYDQVWAAAGTPDTCFPIEPEQLRAVTDATVARIAAHRG